MPNEFVNLISKRRTELMGLATIMIALFHMRLPSSYIFIDFVRDTFDVGYVEVDNENSVYI